jgi:hypothetical protein
MAASSVDQTKNFRCNLLEYDHDPTSSINSMEDKMAVLKSLTFTTIPTTGGDPILDRRTKVIARLEEQKLILKDLEGSGAFERLDDLPICALLCESKIFEPQTEALASSCQFTA